jgi:hypothetical protein
MGDWSDYFEDFPEENPANYDESGQYDPEGRLRKERQKIKFAHEKLDEVLAKKGLLNKINGKK